MNTVESGTVLLYCCPDCSSCLALLNWLGNLGSLGSSNEVQPHCREHAVTEASILLSMSMINGWWDNWKLVWNVGQCFRHLPILLSAFNDNRLFSNDSLIPPPFVSPTPHPNQLPLPPKLPSRSIDLLEVVFLHHYLDCSSCPANVIQMG